MNQKDTFYRGIKYLSGGLPCFFIGPTVIYNALMNKGNIWHYLVLIIGILFCLAAVFLMYKGIDIIMKSIFNK
jgi:Family of unknown function (DUF6095)